MAHDGVPSVCAIANQPSGGRIKRVGEFALWQNQHSKNRAPGKEGVQGQHLHMTRSETRDEEVMGTKFGGIYVVFKNTGARGSKRRHKNQFKRKK